MKLYFESEKSYFYTDVTNEELMSFEFFAGGGLDKEGYRGNFETYEICVSKEDHLVKNIKVIKSWGVPATIFKVFNQNFALAKTGDGDVVAVYYAGYSGVRIKKSKGYWTPQHDLIEGREIKIFDKFKTEKGFMASKWSLNDYEEDQAIKQRNFSMMM